MQLIVETFKGVWESSGIAALVDVRQLIMILLACVLLYLGIVKKFEPLLLVGIAFGMLLTNLPVPEGTGAIYNADLWQGEVDYARVLYRS